MSGDPLGPYDALGFRFDVVCEEPGIRAVLARVLRSLEHPGPAERRYAIAREPDEGLWITTLDGQRVGSASDGRLVVEELVWWINRRATAAWDGILLHGGAVAADDGRAVLLVGASGAGKSTLTAALVDAGFDYLTDELVAARSGTPELVAYPRPMTLKHGSRHLLPHLDPGEPAAGEPVLSMWFVDPDLIRPGSVAATGRVGALVLLDRSRQDDPISVTGLHPAEALTGLVEQSFGLGAVSQAGLDTLAGWCRSLPAVRMAGGLVTERVHYITDRLLQGGKSSSDTTKSPPRA